MSQIDGGLSTIFKNHLPDADWVRIENSVGGGVPDANYCLSGVEGWVELKKVKGQRVAIRPMQVGWIERRLRHGGRVFIAARHGDWLFLFHGSKIRALTQERVTSVPSLLICTTTPARWDWAAIRAILTS